MIYLSRIKVLIVFLLHLGWAGTFESELGRLTLFEYAIRFVLKVIFGSLVDELRVVLLIAEANFSLPIRLYILTWMGLQLGKSQVVTAQIGIDEWPSLRAQLKVGLEHDLFRWLFLLHLPFGFLLVMTWLPAVWDVIFELNSSPGATLLRYESLSFLLQGWLSWSTLWTLHHLFHFTAIEVSNQPFYF